MPLISAALTPRMPCPAMTISPVYACGLTSGPLWDCQFAFILLDLSIDRFIADPKLDRSIVLVHHHRAIPYQSVTKLACIEVSLRIEEEHPTKWAFDRGGVDDDARVIVRTHCAKLTRYKIRGFR